MPPSKYPGDPTSSFLYDSDDLWVPANAVPSVSAASETDRSVWAIPSDPPTPQLAGAALAMPVRASTVPAAAPAIDIEAWSASAMQSLSLATSQTTGPNGAALVIPLVDPVPAATPSRLMASQVAAARLIPRREPVRREAMVKGNEGSRARRRWENNNLVHVPNVTPPSAEDMLPRPTHRVTSVPYQIAAAWDASSGAVPLCDQAAYKLAVAAYARKTQQLRAGLATGLAKGEVPRDLRETARRSPAVRDWVRALEEPLRKWVADQRGVDGGVLADTDIETETETETEVETDDEGWVKVDKENLCDNDLLLFKGRKGTKMPETPAMVFDSIGNDDAAAFKRWIAHTISEYYGLESYSVTLTNPTRRVVYVGAGSGDADNTSKKKKRRKPKTNMHARLTKGELPRPLWEVVC
ncbi:hypothetical protein BROUX41_006621 [Berkeleyomyces rouxiae]|uniref:uncharacterized protein n=1 Tax=Berkeleyomyces rouxiae TaxID=2035830 RepID=UPI003B7838BE